MGKPLVPASRGTLGVLQSQPHALIADLSAALASRLGGCPGLRRADSIMMLKNRIALAMF